MIFYSFGANRMNISPSRVWQIEQSIKSLREHNQKIKVVFFALGQLPPAVAELLTAYNITIRFIPSLYEHLVEVEPAWASAFSCYGPLSRFFCLRYLDEFQPKQALNVDLDTYFFDDPQRLFDEHGSAEVYAREEAFTHLSPKNGPYAKNVNPLHIDEETYRNISSQNGWRNVPCLNTGVMLFNKGVWNVLAANLKLYFDILFRLSVWMVLNPTSEEIGDTVLFRAQQDSLITYRERDRLLEYPSNNHWIKDLVAFSLYLGTMSGVTFRQFAPTEVALGDEFKAVPCGQAPASLLHYISTNQLPFSEWLTESQRVQGIEK